MRLTGWQRIGIVATVCWFIGGGLWINNEVINWMTSDVSAELRRCLAARSIQPDGTIPKETDWKPCNEAFFRDYVAAASGHWYIAAAYTLLPIPLFWLLGWGIIALGRWIRVGFGPAPQQRTK